VSVGSFLDLSFLPINLRKGDAMCIDGGLPGTAARGRLAVMSLPLCGELKNPPCQRCEEVVDPGLDLGVGALAAGRLGTRTSLNEALPSPLFLSAASIVISKGRRARCAATLYTSPCCQGLTTEVDCCQSLIVRLTAETAKDASHSPHTARVLDVHHKSDGVC
jgi:hypothetical protein